jgi:hypothetical protein
MCDARKDGVREIRRGHLPGGRPEYGRIN